MSTWAQQTMIYLSSILLYLIISHTEAINYLDCESFTTQSQCDRYKEEGCYWTSLVSECISINCWEITSDRECFAWETDYNCHWKDSSQICYEHCPKLFDIVFLININDPDDAPKALNYAKSIILLLNDTYPLKDNNHFSLIFFSIINPVIVFDLNTGWNVDRYLSEMDVAFSLSGRNSLLFNKDRANDSKAIKTTKHVFDESNRASMDNKNLRKLVIYISSQNYYKIEDICGYTKHYKYDTNDIDFYGAKIKINGTFKCFGNYFKFITDKIVSYNDLYNDMNYLLSSLCPHTLTPTISPTSDPTEDPTFSPTIQWNKVMITNKTCIDASKGEQYRFKLPFNGIVSGIMFEYMNGWRKEDQFLNTKASYWGSAVLNQFSIFVENTVNQRPLYPDYTNGQTRNIIECEDKYGDIDSNKLLEFYYCITNNNITVNDTEFVLYSPSYTVTTNDEWSVFYADDILGLFKEQNTLQQNMGIICFAINVLYQSMDTSLPTIAPITTTLDPTTSKPTTSKPTTSKPTTSEPTTSEPTTFKPTSNPTDNPIQITTVSPTKYPTSNPTISPLLITTTVTTTTSVIKSTITPTMEPTFEPTTKPTISPLSSSNPTKTPTFLLSSSPTKYPSINPTVLPSDNPTKNPTKNPTTKKKDCCEFFSDVRYSSFQCIQTELILMDTYSDYLIINNNTCLTPFNCGYYGYFSNYRNKQYNECQKYWLNVFMFNYQCQYAVKAYHVYSTSKYCYLCDQHNIDYNDTQYVDGICRFKEKQKPDITTTSTSTSTTSTSTSTTSTSTTSTSTTSTTSTSTASTSTTSTSTTSTTTTSEPTMFTKYPSKSPTFSLSSSTTLNPTTLITERATENEIIIHFEDNDRNNNDNTTNKNGKGNNNEMIKCNNNKIIKCKNDNTLSICLLIIFFSIIISGSIMFIIGCYYRKNYIKKDNEAYNDEIAPGPGSSLSALTSYFRQFSDKSDIEDSKKKKKGKKKEEKKKQSKQKNNRQISKAKKDKKEKKKQNILKKKKEKQDMKSKILAAISDSDDIELQAVISSDDD